jgi:endonuclease YncB( thermonuclease family)
MNSQCIYDTIANNMLKAELENYNVKNTPFFTLEGKEYLCKCVKVYDGDTITVVFKPFEIMLLNSIYKYNIRLAGIDTPELKTNNIDEKKKAVYVRDLLREKILDKFVVIKCGKFDKYGRLLADVYDENKTEHINKWLIDGGFANVYDGGTKYPSQN